MKIRSIETSLTIAALLLTASSAFALSDHTYVSGSGNDANSGTYASPYADFATAVVNTAAGGTVTAETPGDYGPVTITQSIEIDGVPGTTISFGGDGEAIYIDVSPGASVILKNLAINGDGTGSDAVFLAMNSSSSTMTNLIMDNCIIRGFADIGFGDGSESVNDVTLRNCIIDGGGVGELGVRTFQNGTTTPVGSYDWVSVQNCLISNCTVAGIFTRNNLVDVSGSIVKQCAVGLQNDTDASITADHDMIMYCGTGLMAYADGNIVATNDTLSGNGTAIESYPGAAILISNDQVFNNTVGINLDGGIVRSAGNNGFGKNTTAGAPNAVLGVQ